MNALRGMVRDGCDGPRLRGPRDRAAAGSAGHACEAGTGEAGARAAEAGTRARAEAGDETAPAPEPAAEDEELPPLPPDAEPAGPSPQRFNPTEKVRADFPVSFPIDI